MLKGALSPMNGVCKIISDIEMNEANFGAPLTIGLKKLYFENHICCAVFGFSSRASNVVDFIHRD